MVTFVSFHNSERRTRKIYAVFSVLLSAACALGTFTMTMLDDYNDYPGYTCTLRDDDVPAGIPADRLPARNPDVMTEFHPDLGWKHDYELFPVGLSCTYWLREDQDVNVTTHSPWSYSLFTYVFLAVMVMQTVRTCRHTHVIEETAAPIPRSH